MHGTITSDTTGTDDQLGGILDRVGRELRDVAAAIERIEPHLSACGAAGPKGAERTMALQEIDLALQTIHGLADFVGSLARTLPEDCLVETAAALNVIRLAEMRQRLARHAGVEERVEGPARAVGDIELF